MKKLILIAINYFIITSPAFAYLDPGSGGFIVQMVLAFIAMILIFFRSAWYKFKELVLKFFGLFKRKKKD